MGATSATVTDEDAIVRYQMAGQDVPRLLAHWAEHRPDHPALVWAPKEGAGRTWTYRELHDDVRRLAVGLAARGIAKGDAVLLHSENCPEMVLAWLATVTLGATAVTTNTKSVAAEMTYFAEHCRAVAAITQPRYAELVRASAPALRWIAVTADDSGEPAEREPGPDDLAFGDLYGDLADFVARPAEPMLPCGIMFTSGTTSRPKAVVHTHANAIWASRIGPRNIDLGPDDTYLIYLPFFHVNAQNWSLFCVLGVGATAVLMPKWSQSRFWPVVVEHGVTHISLMPFVIPVAADPERPASALRVGVFGLVMPMLDQMLGIDVYAAYGMTETVIHATNGKPSQCLPERSMGRVTPGYELAIVDQETGRLAEEGETGELWLRGTRGIHLFLEYLHNPEANEKAFQDGWFRTGDIVRLGPEGNIFYEERDKDLLKVGGENVSAKEVEGIVGAVPGVAGVAVVGKEHPFLDQVAVAFVIKAPGAPADDELSAAVVEACRTSLASFKVPRAVYFVDSFPTGTLDKLLKNELRAIADSHPPVD